MQKKKIRKKIKDFYTNNKSIITNIFGAYFVKGGSMVLSFFTLPAYIQFFNNQTVLGLWYTLLSVLNWVLMFDFGLGNGLRNKLPFALANNDTDKVRKYISATYFATLVISFLLGVIGWLFIPILNWNSILNVDQSMVSNIILIKCVQIVFSGIMVQIFLKLITSILYAIQKSAVVNFLTLISNILILLSLNLITSESLENNLVTMAMINTFAVNLPLLITTLYLFSTKLKSVYPRLSFVNNKYVKEVMRVGVTLLWLQLIFMVISSTNEFLISYLTSPDAVVEYQAYFKIFNTIAALFSLALAPIWSAVTKAKAESNFLWIKNLYKILLSLVIVAFLFELAVIPYLQKIINIWLGDATIIVNPYYSLIFAISGTVFVLHNVNTSIGNGLSYFKIQMIWMGVAAVMNIPLAYLFVHLFDSWIGVVIANIVTLLPYEILAPKYTIKFIKSKIMPQEILVE